MKTEMRWYEKVFAWLCFGYLMFQASRIWVDYSQYVYFWESGF